MGNLHGVFLNLIFQLFRKMAEKAPFDAAQSALFLLSVKAQIHTHTHSMDSKLLESYEFILLTDSTNDVQVNLCQKH